MAKITTGTTNGDIKITPNGTGKTVVGTGAASATVQSSGDFDLVLQTGNATTGTITITDGADGNIAITPNGNGEVDITKVDIDGGNIDNTTIGGTTPATGEFTTVTSTGNVVVGGGLIVPDNGTVGSTSASTALTISGSGNLGIGTIPSYKLDTYDTSGDYVRFATDNLTDSAIASGILLAAKNFSGTIVNYSAVESHINDRTSGAEKGDLVFKNIHSGTTYERMRIDSSGNLLHDANAYSGASAPQNSSSSADAGTVIEAGGTVQIGRYQNSPLRLNRMNNDGAIAEFRKDGTTTGIIGTAGGRIFIGSDNVQETYIGFNNNYVYPSDNDGAFKDNAIDLGNASAKYDDVYATNGTIITSDRNEKQDIEELSEAEQRVAVAAKGLLRKFRWKSAVEKKGDDARIHFGIIAQDLKAAFEAEGLDAGRYGMFIHSEWWEAYTEVPAVEAQDAVYETQIDEDGNEVQVLVSEAVEAQEAYTRTDTYDTEEEAPEGAVKKDRMGVRYSELLAFIIAAI